MDRLFADSAGARRRYMDRLALALDPAHARHAARYEAALRERNRLLAGRRRARSRLARFARNPARRGRRGAGAQARARLVERLPAALAALPEAPFARPALAYAPGGPLEAEALAAALARGPRAATAPRSARSPARTATSSP